MKTFGSLVLLAATLLVASPLAAQKPPPATEEKRLIEQDPFDQITLDKENGNAVLQVLPLNFPGRKPPVNPRSGDMLKIRLVLRETAEYEVAWKHITKVELYEQLIMAEAEQHMEKAREADDQKNFAESKRRFDLAYDNYLFLLRNYPNITGLKPSLQTYLYRQAVSLLKQQKYAEALSALEELYQQNPNYAEGSRTLGQMLGAVVDRVVNGYLTSGDYRSARMMVTRVFEQYGEERLAGAARSRDALIAKAAEKRDEARKLLDENKLREADQTIRDMQRIWPQIEGAGELQAEISRRFPVLVVGVTRPATRFDPGSIDDWAARRTSRLVHRTLQEFQGAGPEGGEYNCPLGTVQLSSDRRRLTIKVRSDAPQTGYDVSERLLAMARPGDTYLPAWANLLRGIAVNDVNQVNVELRRPHVLPQALLQVKLQTQPPVPNAVAYGDGPYYVASQTDGSIVFRARDPSIAAAGRPLEITEKTYADFPEALAGLQRGEVDVIDQLFPADAARLQTDAAFKADFAIARYAVPTVHFLVPNPKHSHLANRTFRRAVLYAISRQLLLDQDLLGNKPLAGSRLISGPFPAATRPDDPLSYAYDTDIPVRPWNQFLAKTLIQLAKLEMKSIAGKKNEKEPEYKPMVIGHPPHELARVACGAMCEHLKFAGLESSVVELPWNPTPEQLAKIDLRYVEAIVAEPVVDSRRLLGWDGLAQIDNRYVTQMLRQLDVAEDWKDAGQRLKDLHRMVASEVAILPLYQTTEHFAYRKGLTGLKDDVITLYQNVEQWRLPGRK